MVNACHEKNEVKNLGNIVSNDISDAKDCILKRSQLIGFVNKLIGNYGKIPMNVLCYLLCLGRRQLGYVYNV